MQKLKPILLYGAALAVLTLLLKWLEYRFWVRDLSMEIYIGAIAILFTALGVWVGRQLLGYNKPQPEVIPQVALPVVSSSTLNPDVNTKLSTRELEVLELMAAGYSNQEIADKLYVSLSTVKTHTTNLYTKLDVKRRTQAVQKAKDLQILA